MKTIHELALLSEKILNQETKYFADKMIIQQIFKFTSKNFSKQSIISRLTIIDSYYSTQMNKRYYGIEDIAEKIYLLFDNREQLINQKFIEFTVNQDVPEIEDIFYTKNYGIHKDGIDSGKAISLITKYAYFQTNFCFPICDNFAKQVYPLILEKFFDHTYNKIGCNDIKVFIKEINTLKQLSNILDYDKLDNLLWLTGKILNGNFSLILKTKESYKKLAAYVSNQTETYENRKGKKRKRNFSDRIKDVIFDNADLNKIFDDDQIIEMIEFARALNNSTKR